MKKTYACLFAAALMSGWLIAPTAYAEGAAASKTNSGCDLLREEAVNWTALGETVTFRVELTSEDPQHLPGGSYTMIRADGTEIDLGGGGKYIDDWVEGDAPSCEEHLEVAAIGPIAPFGEIHQSRMPHSFTIRDYITGTNVAELMSDAACLAVDQQRIRLYENRPDPENKEVFEPYWAARQEADRALTRCIDKRQIQDQFRETPEILLHLIEIDAPVLSLTRSTYYSDQVALDPETNKLYEL